MRHNLPPGQVTGDFDGVRGNSDWAATASLAQPQPQRRPRAQKHRQDPRGNSRLSIEVPAGWQAVPSLPPQKTKQRQQKQRKQLSNSQRQAAIEVPSSHQDHLMTNDLAQQLLGETRHRVMQQQMMQRQQQQQKQQQEVLRLAGLGLPPPRDSTQQAPWSCDAPPRHQHEHQPAIPSSTTAAPSSDQWWTSKQHQQPETQVTVNRSGVNGSSLNGAHNLLDQRSRNLSPNLLNVSPLQRPPPPLSSSTRYKSFSSTPSALPPPPPQFKIPLWPQA
ncbi:unnamed protein product, partial [Ascophyllum nodosum]